MKKRLLVLGIIACLFGLTACGSEKTEVMTDEQKAAKIAAVKNIYAALEVGEEAKQEIIRLHAQAMGHIAQLGLEPEKAALLENYAKKLIGRTK